MMPKQSGSGISQLTPEQVQKLKETTPFNEKEIAKLLKRYAHFDTSSNGTEGISADDILLFPEFSYNPLVRKVLKLYHDEKTERIYPENFLYFCAALNSKTSVDAKRQIAFRCLDARNSGKLQYDEIFKLYRALFGTVITDQQILSVVFSALHDLQLDTPGVISKDEFNKMVPDHEIIQCFTVDLQLP